MYRQLNICLKIDCNEKKLLNSDCNEKKLLNTDCNEKNLLNSDCSFYTKLKNKNNISYISHTRVVQTPPIPNILRYLHH